MTSSVEQLMNDVLDAIARARVADKRMRLGESLGDDIGVQIAFQAIQYNVFVIGEAVKAMPAEILERDPETPWSDIAAMRVVAGHDSLRIVPSSVQRTLVAGLDPLEVAVRRLRAAL